MRSVGGKLSTSNQKMKNTLFVAILIAGSCTAVLGKDEENKNVTCIFSAVANAYEVVASLGANASAHFFENATLTSFCKSAQFHGFNSSLDDIPRKCNANNASLISSLKSIENLTSSICGNTSTTISFINSTKCFNKNIDVGKDCVASNPPKSKKTKDLCCSIYRTRNCISKGIKKKCNTEESRFRDSLLQIYNSYADPYCAKYNSQCNGVGDLKPSSIAVWTLCLLSVMFFLSENMKVTSR